MTESVCVSLQILQHQRDKNTQSQDFEPHLATAEQCEAGKTGTGGHFSAQQHVQEFNRSFQM